MFVRVVSIFFSLFQRSMHMCAADCCDKKESSVDQVHRCIENCSTPLTQAQSFVQNELSQFQVIFLFCSEIYSCSDRILTCRINSICSPAKVRLVVIDLITSPVVSWRGWETPPHPSTAAQLSFFAQPRLGEDLSLCGGLLFVVCYAFCLRLVDVTGLPSTFL